MGPIPMANIRSIGHYRGPGKAAAAFRGDMTAEDKDKFLGAPYRAVALAEPSVDMERRAGGGIILRPTRPLGDYHRRRPSAAAPH